MRRLLKHPRAGGFPKSGGAEWPDDRFTKRRLADGDITKEEAKEEGPPKTTRSKQDTSAA
jgi:hypothetical protein